MITGDLIATYDNRVFGSPDKAVDFMIGDLNYYEKHVIPISLKIAMKRYLNVIANRLASRNSTLYPSGTTANSISTRTGEGVRSIRESVKVKEDGDTVLGMIGGKFYLASSEFGAVIRAKRSQYLTIPLPAALDGRGVPLKRRARDWADTFIIRSKKNNLLIVQRGAGGKIIPLYVLKKSVRIPKRLGMLKEILNTQGILFQYVKEAAEKEFKI